MKQLLLICLLTLLAVPASADFGPEEAYSHIETHTYDQAPVYFNGQWHRGNGTYHTGVQLVRLEGGQCGAQIMRFLGMQSLFSLSNDPEEAAATKLEDMLLVPEIGTVFIPLPCEDVTAVTLKALEKLL